ncbi:CubicO group peptidase, beta-lactamase class C family [Robiginitalea myxolifaciens]|uniref:CubicO group peptidase, beta-lactamase class C family n=1 Tax=Robiginitalea myxolifaciens TaxID=400055 RepID=A0A1I6G3V9_9FLAO|nr:serine hydrolase domain-containing protein [Robiginitalea myxolifaciens]SFR36898.1 CubicO group peptidase, beta-lactamase class C family [Robiginitalea myxolifaciens]
MKEFNRIYFVFTALSLLLIACQNQSDTPNIKSNFGTALTQQATDDFIESQMESLGMPALSIAIINDGEVVYHRVKGYADKERKIPADNNSIFEGASISKSVFGFFVMTFVEEGILDLDKPLYEYLPNPDIAHDERYKKITARIALSHRSGFPNWRDDYADKKLFIQFEPGTGYHYSGEGYQYLAEVLKHLLDTNWAGLEAEFQKRVAIPFNMEHTKFIKDEYIRKHKVQPYDKEGNWIDKNADPWWRSRDSVFVAPTTIHSEAIDFSKWMIAMMNEQGLSEEGFEELYKPHSEISTGFLSEDYTLGFSRLSILNLGNWYSHSGNNTGFSSYFAFDKDKKWGFVFFTNSKAGDQFALNLTYNWLLSGSVAKQIAIGLTLLFGLCIFLVNLVLLPLKKSGNAAIRKRNLGIGLLTSAGTITSLLLMITVYYGLVRYLYFLLLMCGLFLISKATIRIARHWRENNSSKFELALQAILLLALSISAIAAGLLQ